VDPSSLQSIVSSAFASKSQRREVANVEHSRASIGDDDRDCSASPRGTTVLSRRTALVLLAAGIAPVLLADCSAPAPPAGTPGPTPAPAVKAPAAQPAATVV